MKEQKNSYYAKSKIEDSGKKYLITKSQNYNSNFFIFIQQMEKQLSAQKRRQK